MDATQYATLLSHIDAGATMIAGCLLALIVASTWRG